jgi:hypothetical protein
LRPALVFDPHDAPSRNVRDAVSLSLSAELSSKILAGCGLLALFRNGTDVCEDSTQIDDRLRLQQTNYDKGEGFRLSFRKR